MRRYSELRLLRADGAPGDWERIAESNSRLPALWRVLLGQCEPASAASLHCMENTVRWALMAPAAAAFQRYVELAEFLRQTPHFASVAGVVLHLDALQAHFSALLADWSIEGTLLCATFDAMLSVPHAADTEINQHAAQFRDHWQTLRAAIERNDALAVADLLGFEATRLRVTDWRAWSGSFGFGLFDAEYFHGAFRQPRQVPWRDFDYDPLGSEAQLAADRWRYQRDGCWGVRDAHGRDILRPQWERVLRTSAAEASMVWVQAQGKFGLAAIDGERAGELLFEPCLSAVQPFVDGLAVVRLDNKVGYLRADGQWHLLPQWDDAWAFHHDRAVVACHHRLGYIDRSGRAIGAINLDAAEPFTAHGVARVGQGERWGLLRADGTYALEPQCCALEWSAELQGWLGACENGRTLLHADGSPWMTTFDAVQVLVPQRLLAVRRGDVVEARTWRGERLPIERCRTLTGVQFDDQIRLIARKDNGCGVLDIHGVEVVPFVFEQIETLAPYHDGMRWVETPHLLRVQGRQANGRPKQGIWDLRRGVQLVACEHDYVCLVSLGATVGFLVATKYFTPAHRGAQFRMGLLDAHGRVLLPCEYAWLGSNDVPTTRAGLARIRSALHEAALNSDGDLCAAARGPNVLHTAALSR